MTQSAHPEPLPREQMRASDADRQAVVERLQRAHDDGRLTLAEFDERTQQAYAARTYADLAALTADLPAGAPASYRPPGAVQPAAGAATEPGGKREQRELATRGSSTAWRVVGSTWFAVSAINVLIWGIISLATGDAIYPWWVWVAGPWGAVLLVGWLSGLGKQRSGGS